MGRTTAPLTSLPFRAAVATRNEGAVFNTDFWARYADERDPADGEEFCKFIRDLAVSLRARSVLEVGCSAGGDLKLFGQVPEVSGVDLSGHAIDLAQERFPNWHFRQASATALPYSDSSFDFVFTHKLLNYLEDAEAETAISEMFRVCRRYVATCEVYGSDGTTRDGLRLRDVFSQWLDYKVKVISNVDMHREIEPMQARFTLVRKM